MSAKLLAIIDDSAEESFATELVWIKPEWKEIVQKFTDTESVQIGVHKSYVEFKKRLAMEVEYSSELLDQVRGCYQAQRDEMKKLYEEEGELSYQLWEELDKKRSETHKKIKAVRAETQELKEDLKALKSSLQAIDIYGMDKLLELVRAFNNMDDKSKELFKVLVENYKR